MNKLKYGKVYSGQRSPAFPASPLSCSPYIPEKKKLLFQAKVQRYYPVAVAQQRPAAGMATQELVLCRKSNERGRKHFTMPHRMYHTEDSAKTGTLDHCLSRRRASQLHHAPTHMAEIFGTGTTAVTPRRSIRNTRSTPRRYKDVVSTVIQTQYPPFGKTENLNQKASLQHHTKKDYDSLVAPPQLITGCLKRQSGRRCESAVSKVLSDDLSIAADDSSNHPVPKNRKGGVNAMAQQSQHNVFTYGLPHHRDRVYQGCIDRRSTLGYQKPLDVLFVRFCLLETFAGLTLVCYLIGRGKLSSSTTISKTTKTANAGGTSNNFSN